MGAAATGKKDELVAAILAVSADPAAADDAGLEDELEEPAAEEAAAPAAGADAAAASGKHASIVFALEGKKASADRIYTRVVTGGSQWWQLHLALKACQQYSSCAACL